MTPWAEDVLLELVRALALGVIVARLVRGGRRSPLLAEGGGRLVVGGFVLVLVGTLVDITDNFPALDRFVILGDTPAQAFVEKVVGYLGGFVLIAIGVIRWVPALASGLAQRAQIAAQETEEAPPLGLAEAMDRLTRSQAFLHAVLETMAEGVLVVGSDGVIRYANPRAEGLLGWPDQALEGRTVSEALGEGGRPVMALRRALAEGVEAAGEGEVRTRAGGRVAVALAATPLPEGGVVATFQDMTERLRLEDELRRLAAQDPLTGLANRRELERLTRLELQRAARHGHEVAVLVLDVDRFKAINDARGHQVGDVVLLELARRVRAVARGIDLVARLGGDEFVLVLPETGLEGGRAFAERLVAAVRAEPVAVGSERLTVTISIGVAAFPHHGRSYDALLTAADRALYAAKAGGRDQVCLAPG